ncbi:hypothetical protein K440DRAFT_662632 [Wilcoxina mikolae CBS 423.85]|nr:hypothetical protein K440DRAFT_662632 [Wilcoxina mikolae CBS 423.85]
MGGAHLCVFLALAVGASALSIQSRRTNTTEPVTGYVAQPKVRGTVGILWSCLTTFGLSVWTAMHPNINPNPNAPFSDRILHKLFWAILATLIPELVLLRACSQWLEAKELQRVWCEEFGITAGSKDDIGVEGAYFVLMGGFIAPRDNFKDHTTTLTADGFKWAIKKRGNTDTVLRRGSIHKQDIIDKGKANNIAKLVVCVQAGWMLVQALGRVANGLTVTLLELHVSIQVLIAVVLYTLWWSKPLDVDQPIELPELAGYASNKETENFPLPGDSTDIEMKPTTIHSARVTPEEYPFAVAETPVENPFAETPVENPFIERPPGRSVPPPPLGCFLTEKHRSGAPYILCKVMFDCATAMLASPGQQQLKLGLPAVLIFAYGGLHITAWKAHFPTPVEMWIWRVTCLGMLSAGVILILPFRTLGEQSKSTILHLWTLKLHSGGDIGNFKEEIWKVFMTLRTEVTGNTWERLKFDFSMFSLVIYLFAMVFLTAESIISLRRLPLDAYHTPSWTGFWPHV